jgi:hypothetical protein
LQWVVDHGLVYPIFDGCETVRAAVVDGWVTGDNGALRSARCRCRLGWLPHDDVDPCRDRRTR